MKTPAPILRGLMENGKIKWHGTDARRLAIITKFLEGKEIELTLRAKPKRRSLNQNRYYWCVVVSMLAMAAGYEPEEMHEALKFRFLRIHEDGPLPAARSTTDLTTKEFEEYAAKCRQLGAEMYGLYVPEPNEVEL